MKRYEKQNGIGIGVGFWGTSHMNCQPEDIATLQCHACHDLYCANLLMFQV